jgi:hypothetical protein
MARTFNQKAVFLSQICLAAWFFTIIIGLAKDSDYLLLPFGIGAPKPADTVVLLPGTEKTKPLHCKVAVVSIADRRKGLLRQKPFRWHPELLTSELIHNPLVANWYYVEVEVENTSDRPIQMLASFNGGFSAFSKIADAEGNKIPHYLSRAERDGGKNSLKTILPKKARDLNPGEIVKVPLSLFGKNLDNEFVPRSGVYSIRAIVEGFTFPDCDLVEIESNTCTVKVTERHIRDWRNSIPW